MHVKESKEGSHFNSDRSPFIPPELIQIEPINISTNRRLLESSQSNRLKTGLHHEIERAAGVRLNFFALTLNPMGKTRCLEIEEYAGGYAAKAKWRIEQIDLFTLQAEFGYRVVFTAGLLSSSPRNQREISQTFNGVYRFFTYSNVIMEMK